MNLSRHGERQVRKPSLITSWSEHYVFESSVFIRIWYSLFIITTIKDNKNVQPQNQICPGKAFLVLELNNFVQRLFWVTKSLLVIVKTFRDRCAVISQPEIKFVVSCLWQFNLLRAHVLFWIKLKFVKNKQLQKLCVTGLYINTICHKRF